MSYLVTVKPFEIDADTWEEAVQRASYVLSVCPEDFPMIVTEIKEEK
jgi:hypothetical protein